VIYFRAQEERAGGLQPFAAVIEDGTGDGPALQADQVKAELELVERESHDYVRSCFDAMEERARGGDPAVQYTFAAQLISGRHALPDPARAARWLREAAGQHHPAAQCLLAQLCFDGAGVEKNIDEALTWWRRSAESGHAESEHALGLRHERGEGVPQDYAQAVAWYQKAAARGLARAQYSLAQKYEQGHGVPQDYSRALHGYKQAAEQALPEAQLAVGLMYRHGRGVARSAIEAGKWFQRAWMKSAEARYQYGQLYEEAVGRQRDLPTARSAYQAAAAMGHAAAHERLKYFRQKGW
jgi:TPR repeat protein